MPAPGRAAPDAGISLVEMLVALALFAAVGLASFAVLDTIITVRDRTEGRLERYAAVDRALLLWSRDTAVGDGGGVSLSDAGLSITQTLPEGRATVTYRLQDGDLLRETRIDPDLSVDQRVLPLVDAVTFRFFDARNGWLEAWPPAEPGDLRAVELVLSLALDGGEPVTLRRVADVVRAAP